MRFLLCCAVVALAACSEQDLGKSRDLLPVPPEPGGGCSRELLAAIDKQDAEAVKDLVARGAVVDCPRTSSLLEGSVEYNNLKQLAFMLDAGVDPDVGAVKPRRPQSLSLAFEGHAFQRRDLEATRLLLRHGANPNQRGDYSWGTRRVPTHDGRRFYTRSAVELRDATPLIAAAVAGDIEFAKAVLEAGADPTARDATGHAAMDYAKEVGHRDMVSLLAHFSNPLAASVTKSLQR